MMIKAGLACIVLVGLTSAGFADESCKVRADQRKLAGAALASFMKKCSTEAADGCDGQAATRKLAGAAKASFTKKCLRDAVGT